MSTGDHLLKVKTNTRTRTAGRPRRPCWLRVPSRRVVTRASCRRLSPSAPFLCPVGTFGVRGGPCVNFCPRLTPRSLWPGLWECTQFTKGFRMRGTLAAPSQGTCGHCGDVDSLGDPPEPLPHPVCMGSPRAGGVRLCITRWIPWGVVPSGADPLPGFCPESSRRPGWAQWRAPFCVGLRGSFLTWTCLCSFDILSRHLLLKREQGRAGGDGGSIK